MKIKMIFGMWMQFAEKVNPNIFEAVNSTNVKWEDMGLKELYTDPNDNLSKQFEVLDREKFFLAVVEYGIEYTKLD
jgi:hypothetical protein